MNTKENDLVDEIKNKTILHWNYRGLKELPLDIRQWGDNIEEIYLKENEMTCLPNWISQLSNITNLYLSGNKLREFPDVLITMKQLKVIDLSDNDIKILPDSIKNLQNLRELILDNNHLNQLPFGLSELQCLETLSICRNNFVLVPEWLGSLQKLEILLVDNNCLEELPNRLTLAPALSTLSICLNRLKYLPLNSFISPVIINFNCNPNVNYLSYSMLSQLLELGWDDDKSCLINECDKTIININNKSKNIKLVVNLCSVVHEKKTTIELPRQLLQVYEIDVKTPVSLWELSLRTIYKYKHDNFFNTYQPLQHDIFYNLLLNGPMSVCLNNQCQEPIFTEAWIIVGSSEECTFLVIALFCSQKCASIFDVQSHGIEPLSWDFFNG